MLTLDSPAIDIYLISFLSLVSSSPTLKWHTLSTPVNYAAQQFTFPSGVMRTFLLFIRPNLIFATKMYGQIISQEETTNKLYGRVWQFYDALKAEHYTHSLVAIMFLSCII